MKNASIVFRMIRKKSIICLLCLVSYCAKGQELDQGHMRALPKNLNTIAVDMDFPGAMYLSDPALPVSNFKVIFKV
jgi:hypothetical protein